MSAVVHDSVEIVNAAANAITAAESRAQIQPSAVCKRRWGNRLNLYWSSCFGSYSKHSKRVGHALIVSEPALQASSSAASNPATIETSNSRGSSTTTTTTLIFPFIAPPSSPASFLQSDPPSSTQTPNGPLTMASPAKTAQIYTIGPYAHETQLVSPPVFSTFTTEPSTACFTPPPETVAQSPSSPEVPFAQLLMSSLARNRRNSNGPGPYAYQKYSLSQCEFKPYYQNPSSPGSNTKSPGSAMSASGACSPFPGCPLSCSKWGSKVGSGALTPSHDGMMGQPCNRESCNVLESQVSEVVSLAPGDDDDVIVDDHRVSFELIGEDIPTCIVRAVIPSREVLSVLNENSRRSNEDALSEVLGMIMTSDVEGEEFNPKNRTVSLGSSKDFNFSYASGEASTGKSPVDCEWWTNEKVVDNRDW